MAPPLDDEGGSGRAPGESLRVLLIEHDDDDAELILLTLAREGFAVELTRVQTEGAVAAALDGAALDGAPFDIVLSDHRLVGFDAHDALRVVRAGHPDLPFIIVSGTIDEELAVTAMRAGADDYVLKANMVRLRTAVRRQLAEAAGRRARRAAEQARAEGEARMAAIVETAADAIITLDDLGAIDSFNPAAQRMFGWAQGEVMGTSVALLLAAPHRDERGWYGWRSLPELAGGREVVAQRRDGTTFPVELSVGEARVGGRLLLTVIMRDLSERKALEAHLETLALYDALTGLPNRILFLDRLAARLGEEPPSGQPNPPGPAVLFIDVDRFRVVNESLGHETGDRLLQVLAARLQATLGPDEFAGRFGADEFLAFIEAPDSAAAAARAHRIAEALSEPVQLDDAHAFPSVTIGVARAEDPGVDAHVLTRDAEAALRRAREVGATIELYGDYLRRRADDRLRLENELHAALRNQEFLLHYQPVVEMPSRRIVAVEALVRWLHPTRGLVPPGDFIPAAEESGLITRLGSWVLTEACRQAAEWAASLGALAPRVAVNLSVRDLLHVDLVDGVARTLHESGVDPSWVSLEITENMLEADTERVLEVLLGLRGLGLHLAVDDFGTGYSSLSRLKRFPVGTVKIDQSFVAGLGVDEDDLAITEAIVAMARALRLGVIAEGVETEFQADLLARMGCQHAQGYFFSRPVPAADITALLDAQAAATAR